MLNIFMERLFFTTPKESFGHKHIEWDRKAEKH